MPKRSITMVAAFIAIAAVAAGVIAYYYSSQLAARIADPNGNNIATYTAGNFTVYVVQDDEKRFVAKLENKGPSLTQAAVFAVRRGFSEDSFCEPQGMVLSNFNVSVDQNGKITPQLNPIQTNSNVTIDSAKSKLNSVPIGKGLETTVYVMELKPESVYASNVIQTIPLSNNGSSLSQEANNKQQVAYDDCVQKTGTGYPLLLKITNPQKGTTAHIELIDDAAGKKYDTAINIPPDATGSNSLYWPPSKEGWLADNFTKPSGPAPSWNMTEMPKELKIVVTVISPSGEVKQQAEGTVPITQEQLQTGSYDFVQVSKGDDPLPPAYPKFWQLEIDMSDEQVS